LFARAQEIVGRSSGGPAPDRMVRYILVDPPVGSSQQLKI
jgi:hypothetical protein